MNRRITVLLFIFLIIFVIYSRETFKFPFLYSWDSVQFALSINDFDLSKHQPHPPGYIFYVPMIKAMNYFMDDPNASMIALNMVFTIIGCVFIFLLTWELSKNTSTRTRFLLSFGASALYATNPINWFYGSVAEIYSVEGGLVPFLTYLIVVSRNKPHLMPLTSLALGIVGGIRLTTEVFLLPAYLYVLLKTDHRTILKSLSVLLFANLAWLIPTGELAGGIERYTNMLFNHTRQHTTRTAGFNAEVSMEILIAIIQGITLPILALLAAKITKIRIDSNQRILLIAFTPALLFFLFVHYPKQGYFLFLLPLLIALSLSLLTDFRKVLALLFLSVVINILIFLIPAIYTTNEVKTDLAKRIAYAMTFPNKHTRNVEEQRLKLFFKKIADLGDRKKAFVEQPGYWPDWRFIMYYFPEDTAVLLLPKKHASVAQNQVVENDRQPIVLSGDERLIITIGETPVMHSHMRSFDVDGHTFHFGYLRNFPDRFRIYEFQFFKAQSAGASFVSQRKNGIER